MVTHFSIYDQNVDIIDLNRLVLRQAGKPACSISKSNNSSKLSMSSDVTTWGTLVITPLLTKLSANKLDYTSLWMSMTQLIFTCLSTITFIRSQPKNWHSVALLKYQYPITIIEYSLPNSWLNWSGFNYSFLSLQTTS